VVTNVFSTIPGNFAALGGKREWMEGVQLLAVYCVIAIAIYFPPPWG